MSEFEACFALCQCYDANDNPTHEHQAICVLDECFCVFDSCPYGRYRSHSNAVCCVKCMCMCMTLQSADIHVKLVHEV